MGYGPETLRDQLGVLGPYIDLAKIAVGSARLYPRDLLIERAAIYDEFGISPFLGGGNLLNMSPRSTDLT